MNTHTHTQALPHAWVYIHVHTEQSTQTSTYTRPRICGPHTYKSLAATYVYTHTLHTFSHAKLFHANVQVGMC